MEKEKKENEFGRRIRNFVEGSICYGFGISVIKFGLIENLFKEAYSALSSLPTNVAISEQNSGVVGGTAVVLDSAFKFVLPITTISIAATSFLLGSYFFSKSLE